MKNAIQMINEVAQRTGAIITSTKADGGSLRIDLVFYGDNGYVHVRHFEGGSKKRGTYVQGWDHPALTCQGREKKRKHIPADRLDILQECLDQAWA